MLIGSTQETAVESYAVCRVLVPGARGQSLASRPVAAGRQTILIGHQVPVRCYFKPRHDYANACIHTRISDLLPFRTSPALALAPMFGPSCLRGSSQNLASLVRADIPPTSGPEAQGGAPNW